VSRCETRVPPRRDPLAYSYMDYRNVVTEEVGEDAVIQLEFLSGSLHGAS
jgi:hypothetical protein